MAKQEVREEPPTAVPVGLTTGNVKEEAVDGFTSASEVMVNLTPPLAHRILPIPYRTSAYPHFAYKGSSPRKHRISSKDSSASEPKGPVFHFPELTLRSISSESSSSATTNATTASATTTITKTTSSQGHNTRFQTPNSRVLSPMEPSDVNRGSGGEPSYFPMYPSQYSTPSPPYMPDEILGYEISPMEPYYTPSAPTAPTAPCAEHNVTPTRRGNQNEYRMVGDSLSSPVVDLYAVVDGLQSRMIGVEQENARLRSLLEGHQGDRNGESSSAAAARPPDRGYRGIFDDRSRSPSPIRDLGRASHRESTRDEVEKNRKAENIEKKRGKTRQKKDLKVMIPTKIPVKTEDVGMPTPITSGAPSAKTPWSFSTAQHVLPSPAGSESSPKTGIHKRDVHNLNSLMPPALTHMPLLPLTDTELIVYFFNSVSRPIVALRLYARGWAPAQITTVLNDHRDINPPYLRNTCSVKCTTALKLGKKKWGEDWEEDNCDWFVKADNCSATDMIHLAADEVNDGYNIEMYKLCKGLKKYPTGKLAGIFTKCVKHCKDNNLNHTVAEAHLLAMEIDEAWASDHPTPPKYPVRAEKKVSREERVVKLGSIAGPSHSVEGQYDDKGSYAGATSGSEKQNSAKSPHSATNPRRVASKQPVKQAKVLVPPSAADASKTPENKN